MAVMIINYQLSIMFRETSGGYCGRVPPLPIPNREVKPACADGTAMQCGRVGSRLLSNKREPHDESCEAFFVCFPEWPDRLDNLVFLDLLYRLEKLAIQDIMSIKITVPRYNGEDKAYVCKEEIG